eukprot:CFRG5174T1
MVKIKKSVITPNILLGVLGLVFTAVLMLLSTAVCVQKDNDEHNHVHLMNFESIQTSATGPDIIHSSHHDDQTSEGISNNDVSKEGRQDGSRSEISDKKTTTYNINTTDNSRFSSKTNIKSIADGYDYSDSASGEKKIRVSYVFLTHEGLPLWDVWEEFFSTCYEGTYDVIAHIQHMLTIKSKVPIYQMPDDMVVKGAMRFNFNMVKATFRLYRVALERACGVSNIDNCTPDSLPDFIHLASDSCAPIMTCRDLNRYLQHKTGNSFVEEQNRWYTYVKSSQWVTLTGMDVLKLLENEHTLEQEWKDFAEINNGLAPDEWVIATELHKWGSKTHKRVLTFAGWPHMKWFVQSIAENRLQMFQQGDRSHPFVFDNSRLMRYALDNLTDYPFIRKVEGKVAKRVIMRRLVAANTRIRTEKVRAQAKEQVEVFFRNKKL